MSLIDQIAGYFRRRDGVMEGRKRERMAEDRAKILDIDSWPLVVLLPMKPQPWREPMPMRSLGDFGDLWLGDLQASDFVVRDKNDQSKVVARYASLDALVEEWSVD